MIQIGRAGTDHPLNGARANVGSISAAGDEITIKGVIAVTASTPSVTKAIARHQRSQILALAGNPDEDVVPIVDDDDDHINGYWRILDSGVDDPEDPDQIYYQWTVKAVRVADSWQAPLTAIKTLSAVRTNSHSVDSSTAAAYVAYPATAVADRFVAYTSASAGVATRYGENGDVLISDSNIAAGAAPYDATIAYLNAPEDHYVGACAVKVGSRVASATAPDVSGFLEVNGRQVANDPTAVMITNDMRQILYGPSTGQLLVGQWQDSSDGGADAWTYKAYKLTRAGVSATSLGDPISVTVLYNRPDMASVRFWYDTGSQAAAYADITLRRGATWVEIHMADPRSGSTALHGVFRYTVEAGTTAGVTGGLNANADDGDSNKYRIRCNRAFTADTTNGGLYLSSAVNNATFGIDTDFIDLSPDVDAGFWAVVDHIVTMRTR